VLCFIKIIYPASGGVRKISVVRGSDSGKILVGEMAMHHWFFVD
jgi:hypothetical protein